MFGKCIFVIIISLFICEVFSKEWELNIEKCRTYNGFHEYNNVENGNYIFFARCGDESTLFIIDSENGEVKHKEGFKTELTELQGVMDQQGNFVYLYDAEVSLHGTNFTFNLYDIEKRTTKEIFKIDQYLDQYVKGLYMIKNENYFIFETKFYDRTLDYFYKIFVFDHSYNMTYHKFLDLDMPIRATQKYLYSAYPGDGAPDICQMYLNDGSFENAFQPNDKKKLTNNEKTIVLPDGEGNVFFGLKMKFYLELLREHLYISKYTEQGEEKWTCELEETNGDLEDFNYFINGDYLIIGAEMPNYSYYYSIKRSIGIIMWNTKSEKHEKKCATLQPVMIKGVKFGSSLCGSKLHIIELNNGKTVQTVTYDSHLSSNPVFDDEGIISCSVLQGNTNCKKTKYIF